MQFIPVISSDLSQVGYDAETSTLVIIFNSGGTYSYSNVPLSVYSGLLSAPSKGRYFHAYIKNYYAYTRVA